MFEKVCVGFFIFLIMYFIAWVIWEIFLLALGARKYIERLLSSEK